LLLCQHLLVEVTKTASCTNAGHNSWAKFTDKSQQD
jgi:hypothetical protein